MNRTDSSTTGTGINRWLGPLALVAAVVVAWSGSLAGPFVFDDIAAVRENPTIRVWWNSVKC